MHYLRRKNWKNNFPASQGEDFHRRGLRTKLVHPSQYPQLIIRRKAASSPQFKSSTPFERQRQLSTLGQAYIGSFLAKKKIVPEKLRNIFTLDPYNHYFPGGYGQKVFNEDWENNNLIAHKIPTRKPPSSYDDLLVPVYTTKRSNISQPPEQIEVTKVYHPDGPDYTSGTHVLIHESKPFQIGMDLYPIRSDNSEHDSHEGDDDDGDENKHEILVQLNIHSKKPVGEEHLTTPHRDFVSEETNIQKEPEQIGDNLITHNQSNNLTTERNENTTDNPAFEPEYYYYYYYEYMDDEMKNSSSTRYEPLPMPH